MKTCLLILLILSAQQSILFVEELDIAEFLFEYTVIEDDLPDDLSAYGIIVISTPSELFEESEIQALQTFVSSGGGVMLLAEENNKEGTTLVLNQIAQKFSITFNTDKIYDDTYSFHHPSWITLTEFPEHPVFQGIERIVYTSGCSLTGEGLLVHSSQHAYAEKYDGLITYKKGESPACIALLEVGTGRIFACGDKEFFDTYLSLEDNTLFALNVFDWLAGNSDRITERQTYKSDSSRLIAEAESLMQSALDNGLKEILPQSVEMAESLISEAKTLYGSYRYSDAHDRVTRAKQSIIDGQNRAEILIDTKIAAAQECLSKIEMGAKKYLPSQFEAALYYMQEAEHQETYAQKIEKAEKALELCEEIRAELEGAAKKEIQTAAEKMDSYKGLFGRKSHHSARIYVEYAEESYDRGEYGDALTFAEQSQIYSDQAEEEQKKDYILAAGVILIGVLLVYIYVRK
jgi:hypothetical protein